MRKSIGRRARGVLAVGVAVLAAGCGGGGSHPADSRETVYRGRYVTGFEVNAFTPCGSSESWWTEGTIPGTTFDYSPVYLEARGTVSGPGQYGQNGAYRHNFQVREIKTLSRDIPDGCR